MGRLPRILQGPAATMRSGGAGTPPTRSPHLPLSAARVGGALRVDLTARKKYMVWHSSCRSSRLHTGNGVESQRLRDAKNAARPGANVSSMSDNEAWPWTAWQWTVLVVLVLLAAAVVAVDTHILFGGGWPL